MKVQNSRLHLAARRGELLAELFFQELDPVFVSRPTTQEIGYDLLVGFANEKAGINTFGIEVKTTERPLGSHFPISRHVFNRLAHSNVPGLLLVADVKRNRLYYAWLRSKGSQNGGDTILIPLVEINEITKRELKKQFEKAHDGVTIAG